MEETKKSSAFFARGWLMVLITFITAIVTQGFGLYSFSMLKVPMTAMLGDGTAVAFGFSIYAVVAGVMSLFVGDIIQKLGLRWSLILSAIFFSGGFFIISMLNSIALVYVAYVVMGIGSALGGMIVVSGIPSNWFVKRRGIAMGVTWCATLPGSLLTTTLISSAAADGDWQRAAMILGIISLVVMFAASFVLKWRPQEVGLLPDGMTEAEASRIAEHAGSAKLVGLNRKQAVKTLVFWLLFISFAMIGIGEQGPLQNFPTYLVAHKYDLATAGFFMTFLSLAGVCGKLTSGFLIDKIGPGKMYFAINLTAAAGIFAIMMAGTNLTVLFIAGFFFGAALSSSAVCFSVGTSKYLGPKHFGQLYGIVFIGKPLADAIGVPLISSLGTGSVGWSGAFIVAIIFILISAFCMLFAKKNKQLIALETEARDELVKDLDQKEAAK